MAAQVVVVVLLLLLARVAMAETDGSRFSDGGNEHGDSGDGRVGGSGVTSGRGGGGRGLECVLRISHPDPQWLYCSSSSVDERGDVMRGKELTAAAPKGRAVACAVAR